MSLPRGLRKTCLILSLCPTLIFAGTGSGQSDAADFSEYSWEPVPGSAYYQGIYSNPAPGSTPSTGKKSHFRTPGTRVLLPTDSSVGVGAYSTKGRALLPAKKLEVKSRRYENPTPQPSPPPTPPPPQTALEPVPETQGETKKIEESIVEPEGTNEAQKARAKASIGIGRERIASQGGVSQFSGSTMINTTKVALAAPLAGPQPLLINIELEGHIFATRQKVEGSATGESEKIKEFTRLTGVGSVRADMLPLFDRPSQRDRLYGEAGIEFMQMPSLEVGDVETSAAVLHSAGGFGPMVGMHYLHLLPEDTSEIRVGISILPFMTGLVESGSAVEVSTGWQYFFSPLFYSDVGINSRRDSVSVVAGCNSDATCRNKSTSLSTITTVELGFGARF